MEEIIRVKSLYKSYSDIDVLRGIDLSVKKGEFVCIIGSSGSGKSTLIRCLNGLEEIDSGSIEIDGKNLKDINLIAEKIGMVFQEFNLFPHYTVLDNIVKPCITVKKMSKKSAKDLAYSMLEMVKLGDKAKSYPISLSGGQKQRLAIARALSMSPEIVLFDEPTSSLDPELSHEVFDTIKSIASGGLTIVMVTHQMDIVLNFASRVIFLEDGKIAFDGNPEELLRSDNKKIQSFLSKIS